MESKKLFHVENDGYRCEDVEKYIDALKAEYKKIFEYAKNTESTNEKLKKICRALQEENKALKAAASDEPKEEKKDDAFEGLEKITALIDELAAEGAALKAKLNK